MASYPQSGKVMLVLETDGGNVWIYDSQPVFGEPSSPAITAAPSAVVPGASYNISGTQFNGLSQGAGYGDDQQAATNYPISMLLDINTNNWYFGRSSNPTSMSVAPQQQSSFTLTVPEGTPEGDYLLYVGASGNYSLPWPVKVVKTTVAKAPDFDGDLHTDMVWRNRIDGTVAIWMMDGPSVAVAQSWLVTRDWNLVGTGDFFGAGHSDLLWRHKDGAVAYWRLSGATIVSAATLGVIDNSWVILGTSDFDGDGTADIIWRNTHDGTLVIWLMKNGQIASSAAWSVPLDWTLRLVGNFQRGRSSVFWTYLDNTVVSWTLYGLNLVGSSNLGTYPPQLQLSTSGTFASWAWVERDWQADPTNVFLTYCKQCSNGSYFLGSAGRDWTITGSGNYFGDLWTELTWRNVVSGALVLWKIENATVTNSYWIGTVPLDWALIQ